MDVLLQIRALEDRIRDLEQRGEKPLTMNFLLEGKHHLTITPDKKFLVKGVETTNIDAIVGAFREVVTKMVPPARTTSILPKGGLDA